MDFQFKLNLQRLAKQSYAVSFWERKETRKKMKDYFYKNNKVKAENEWNNITKTVIELLNPDTLPFSLYAEMVYIIMHMGKKILDWFNSLKNMNLFGDMDRRRLYDVYLQDIHWTYYGTIDGLKILRSWMNIPNIDSPIIFNMACLYCLEDEIDALWKVIPRKLKKQLQALRKGYFGKYGFYIISYWLAQNDDFSTNALQRFNRAITNEGGDLEEFLNADQSPEANMFVFSARKGYTKAVEYFWESICPEEQEKNLITALSWALRVIGSRHWNMQYHRKEQYIETCIFLMKKLNENKMKEAIQYKFRKMNIILFGIEPEVVSQNIQNILDLFINIWPWQEFFMTAFNLVKSYLNKKNYQHILQVITFYMEKDIEFDYPVKNNIYQRMLLSVWREMPDKMKNIVEWSLIDCLFRSWDMPSIKTILNDPFTNKIRVDFLEKLFVNLNELLYNDQTEKVDQFIDQVFDNDDEKNRIPEIKIYKFIVKDQFDSLKNLQDLYSEEEFGKIKCKINSETICHYLILRNEFDLADKFLYWRFDSEDEANKFKFEFKEKDFSRKHIFRIWIKSDQKTAEEATEKFLRWFLRTPEDLALYKLEGIILAHEDYDFDEENSNRFYQPFVEADRYDMVIALLEWCGIEEQYIKQFKKVLIPDVRLSLYMERNQTDRVEKFLKWASDNEEERTCLLRNFVNSKVGFSSCKKFVGSTCCDNTGDLTEIFKKFIHFWIVPTGNIKKIQRKLILWKERLKKLDEGEDVEEEWDLWSNFEYRDDSDRSVRFEKNEIYCSEENLYLFLNLLESFKTDDDQNEPDNDEDDDDDDNDGDDDDVDDDDSSNLFGGSSYDDFDFFDGDEDEETENSDDEDDDYADAEEEEDEDEDGDKDEDNNAEAEDEENEEENEEDGAKKKAIEFAQRIFHAISLGRSSDEESESHDEEAGDDALSKAEDVGHDLHKNCRVD